MALLRRRGQLLKDRRRHHGPRRDRRGQVEQIVPTIEDQSGIDRRPDLVRQRGICISLLERMELPVVEIAQSRCEPLADQGEQPEDVITRAARIGKVLLDVEDRILIE